MPPSKIAMESQPTSTTPAELKSRDAIAGDLLGKLARRAGIVGLAVDLRTRAAWRACARVALPHDEGDRSTASWPGSSTERRHR